MPFFGDTKTTNDIINNPYKYNAEATDSSTGLQYLRARYYDSSKRRFVSKDTYQGSLEEPLSRNGYAYVNNNPLNYIDPSGHIATSTIVTIAIVTCTLVKIGVDLYQTCKHYYSKQDKINKNIQQRKRLEKRNKVKNNSRSTKKLKEGKQKNGKYIAIHGSKTVRFSSKKEFKEYKVLCEKYDKLKAQQDKDLTHDMLDICSDIPVIGPFFSAENAMLYAYEKDYKNSAKSVFSAINKFKKILK